MTDTSPAAVVNPFTLDWAQYGPNDFTDETQLVLHSDYAALSAQLADANTRADGARDAAISEIEVHAWTCFHNCDYEVDVVTLSDIIALRDKSAPEVTVDAVVSNPLMQEQFADWFRRNYPGPDTIIGDPDWHAPRILNAAIWFINNPKKPRAIAGVEDE